MRFVLLLLPLLAAAQIRVGIVGTDTSHAVVFTKLLNDPADPKHVRGAKVIAAFKGGSPDLPDSANRVEKYAEELRTKWGVRFYDDIAAMTKDVDAILLESVDGRVHLEQARQVFASGKPVFIDKPLAATYADAKAIAALAAKSNVAWFSASSLRWAPLVAELKSPGNKAVITWGPAKLDATHKLDLSWYAIHPIEMLFAILGPGCAEVTRVVSGDVEIVTGKWKDGRLGTVQLVRPESGYGAIAFRGKQSVSREAGVDYSPMVADIVKFFETKQPPVSPGETLEIFGFMEAARLSKEQGGRPVKMP